MKKLILFVFLILIFMPAAAFASPSYDMVLSEKISEYGVFSGGQGIVYAEEKSFENRGSLFLVRITDYSIDCEVYDDADGIQLTDSIEFPYADSDACKIAVVKKDGADFVMFSAVSGSKTVNQFFTLQNDAFTQVQDFDYDAITYIAGYENGKIVTYVSTVNVYHFLNSLKEETIAEYPFTNKINTITAEEAAKIKTTLTACADIMSFDIKDYDYDTLFKYVLYTHQNFQILTDIPSGSGNSSSLGYNNVSIVKSDFIDYIMEKLFRITPEKPPVNNLLSRGFCYSDGYYYYTGGFNVYFATEVLDLVGVYDMGGGVTFVVFSDIYYENDTQTPEYSFAVLQKTGETYSLLRLGMGENLPSQEEVKKYAPFSSYGSINWSNTAVENDETSNGGELLPILLLIISVGTVGFICAVVALIKQRRR